MQEEAPLPAVVNACETTSVEDEYYVAPGTDGNFFTTLIYEENGNMSCRKTKASMGMVRVFNQTQMSHERHQVSHISMGKYTLRTPDGRACGSSVKWGEMEVQSTSSAGLQSCDREIPECGDCIMARFCWICQCLGLLCTCTTEDNHIQSKVPYDTVVLDCINTIVYNGSFQYQFLSEL